MNDALVAAVVNAVDRLVPVVDPSEPAVNSRWYTTCTLVDCSSTCAARKRSRRRDDTLVHTVYSPVPESCEQIWSTTTIELFRPAMLSVDTSALTNAPWAALLEVSKSASTPNRTCEADTVTTERKDMVGAVVGWAVGWRVGCLEGWPVGWRVGWREGCAEGCLEGCLVGCVVGCLEGLREGWPVGRRVGCPEGLVGCLVGCADGCMVGCLEGLLVGCPDGCPVGRAPRVWRADGPAHRPRPQRLLRPPV